MVASLLRLKPFMGRAVIWLFVSGAIALAAQSLSLVIPQLIQQIIDGPIAHKESAAVLPLGLLVLVLGAIEGALYYVRRMSIIGPASRVEARMRTNLYAKLQDLPVSFHDKWPSGQLLSRAIGDLGTIRRWVAFGLVFLVVNVITVLIGTAILVSISPMLGLIFFVCAIPLWWVGYRFEGAYGEQSRLSQDQTGDLATAVEESVHGIRVLKAFGRGSFALKTFRNQAETLRQTELAKAKLDANIWAWIMIVPTVSLGICLLLGGWQVASGDLSVGKLVAFFATATALGWPIESLGFFLAFTIDARTATDRYFDIVDTENEVSDPAKPATITHPRGHLAFRDVRFRYADAPVDSPDLLAGIDLSVEPGETMALVGLTGSGKTTMVALTARLYDVTGGAVELDGVDVRNLTREELRRHLALAFEDATLFSLSVRDNVLLGRPDLVGDDPAVKADAERVLENALQIAQAEFVHKLPDGVNTVVGEEGMSLSGGQRQRLALARAVAARPSVLVLDDPLSALDVATEAKVEAALRSVLGGTTALIVAHRPSTVALADRVALLENGRITAVGTHTELLATSEHYRYVISSLEASDRPQRDAPERDDEPNDQPNHEPTTHTRSETEEVTA